MKKEKRLYILHLGNYGDLSTENDSSTILKVSFDKEVIINEIKKYLIDDTNYHHFVIDENTPIDDLEKYNIIRLFYNYQENWGKYFEYIISEIEATDLI